MDRKLKILVLNYEYPPLGGGGGVGTRALCEEFVKMGHNITVMTSHIRGEKFFEVQNGVNIYRLPVLGRTKLHTGSMISLFTWPFVSILFGLFLCLRYRYDLLFTHFFAPTGPTGLVLGILFQIPNCIYAHGGDVYDPDKINKTPSGRSALSRLLKVSLKIQSKYAKLVITQTSDLKNKLSLLGVTKDKIITIPLPFLPGSGTYEAKREKKGQEFRLISIGRFVPRKGFQYLISAMLDLPPNVKLTLIGDGAYAAYLKTEVMRLGLSHRVQFVGFVTDAQHKYKLLSEADCFVLASEYEAMGVVLLEAMSVGLPIVSTNNGGQVDILKDKRNAILVNPKDPAALVESINLIKDNPVTSQNLSKNNLFDIKNFLPKHLAQIYIARFFEVID